MNPDAEVLIVENDDAIRQNLAALLEDEGFNISTAANDSEALFYLDCEPLPKVILLNLSVPGMSGWQLRARLLQDPDLCEIPVVVVSQALDVEQHKDVLRAAEYFEKPLKLTHLLSSLARYC